MIRVKICGITRAADAVLAKQAGADALGFIFYAKSQRRADPKIVKKAVSVVGAAVTTVGVFVNERLTPMLKTAQYCGLHAIQLHGDENERVIERLQREGYRVIKAFRVGEKDDFSLIRNSPADALLFDTAQAGRFGGTGMCFDWRRLLGKKIKQPWMVSGGLHAENVRVLLGMLTPYGVDVSSGVETAPGKKSKRRMQEFIRNAKSA